MTEDTRDYERKLLRKCRRGNDRAARALCARFCPGLGSYARTLMGDATLAEDAVQGALCTMMGMTRREIDRVRDPRPWLAQLVRHEALTLMRTRRRSAEREHAAGNTTQNNPETTRAAGEKNDETQRIGQAVEALPRRYREVIVLKHICGLTFEQIGTVLSMPTSTAHDRGKKGLNNLQKMLDPTQPLEVDRV